MNLRPLLRPGIAALVLGALAGAAQAQPRFKIFDLGTLGGPESSAAALNEQGAIVGFSNHNHLLGEFRAFAWSEGTMNDIGGLTKKGASIATGINESDTACGSADGIDGLAHAVTFTRKGVTDLSAQRPDWLDSAASAINDAGHVVGIALSTTDFMAHAFLWTGGKPKMLSTPGSSANGINNHDQFVGAVFSMAMLFDHGEQVPLGTLGGSFSEASAINDDGAVTGWAAIAIDQGIHAFRWHEGAMADLGTLGGEQSRGDAIAANGDIVGWSHTHGLGGKHAVLVQGETMFDLNDLLDAGTASDWELLEAFGINDAGVIVGQGTHHGKFHAFVLKPIAQ
jgi:probable HAF family extracellular repeat protein